MCLRWKRTLIWPSGRSVDPEHEHGSSRNTPTSLLEGKKWMKAPVQKFLARLLQLVAAVKSE